MNDFSMTGRAWFDGAPEPVLWLHGGAIAYANPAAVGWGLEPGEVPAPLRDLEPEEVTSVDWKGRRWMVRSAPVSGGVLVQLTPEPGAGLTPDRLSQLAGKLRAPLGNLIGAIQLLEYPHAQRSEEKERQYRAIERKNYHILLRMLDNLELLGTLEEETPLRPVVLDFGGLCADVTRQVSALAEQAGRSVRLECRDGNLLVRGEEPLLRRLLFHLISNALRAAGAEGEVRLGLEKRAQWVRLTVSDSGGGFSAGALSRAFAPEEPQTGLNGGEGLGLGISICRLAAEKHGGRIALLGGGSGARVVVELPLAQSLEGGDLHSRSDYTGGLNEALIQLSDVLPWQCFAEEA